MDLGPSSSSLSLAGFRAVKRVVNSGEKFNKCARASSVLREWPGRRCAFVRCVCVDIYGGWLRSKGFFFLGFAGFSDWGWYLIGDL